jgi:hypothetical protein
MFGKNRFVFDDLMMMMTMMTMMMLYLVEAWIYMVFVYVWI